MDTRVNLMATAIVAGFFLVGVGSPLVGWLHVRRVDLVPTVILTAFGLIAGAVLAGVYVAWEDRRPVVFFGVFFGLIILPWVAIHAISGPQAWKESSPRRSAALTEEAAPVVIDITTGGLDAEEAKLAHYPDGTSMVTVRYTDAAAAAAGLSAEYGRTPPPLTQVAGHQGVFTDTEGVASFHFQDGARVVRVTGATRAALERRLERPSPGARPGAGPSDFVQLTPGGAAIIGGALVYTLFVAWVYLRLVTWAAPTYPALAGVAPLPPETLRQRLLEVARAAVPFTVRPGDRPDELIAEWRYADATWLDQMRAHRMTKLIRYRLRLDEAKRTVRVLEYRSEFDASAGGGGASLSYRAQFGAITFFETQNYTLLGVQIRDGRITPDLSYTWRFDVDELRYPLVRIITSAGWTWRQVMLDAPRLTG